MIETKIFEVLSGWLSKCGFEVYWNRKNSLGYGTFGTEGKRKPDLFLRRRENPNWYNTILEVKPGDSDFQIRAGIKILEYWQDYAENKTEYFVLGERVYPKYFLLATDWSLMGRLFSSDDLFKPVNSEGSRKVAIGYGMIPQQEYIQTFNFVRQLWAIWRDVYNRHPGTALGVLLSDQLNGGLGRPAFMYEIFDSEKGRWIQRWRKF